MSTFFHHSLCFVQQKRKLRALKRAFYFFVSVQCVLRSKAYKSSMIVEAHLPVPTHVLLMIPSENRGTKSLCNGLQYWASWEPFPILKKYSFPLRDVPTALQYSTIHKWWSVYVSERCDIWQYQMGYLQEELRQMHILMVYGLHWVFV